MANLFIIGNGFDRAHHLNTSYRDFYEYLRQRFGEAHKWALPYIFPKGSKGKDCNDFDAAHLIMKLVSHADATATGNTPGKECENLWRHFEDALGCLDYSRFFTSGYMYTASDSLEISIPKIKRLFCDWINTISIQNTNKMRTFSSLIDPENDFFVSFNYTQVLEKLYGAKNVCHVHGSGKDDILFGHGDSSQIKVIAQEYANNEKKLEIVKYSPQKETRHSRTDAFPRYKGYLSKKDFMLCISSLVEKCQNNLPDHKYFRMMTQRKARKHKRGLLDIGIQQRLLIELEFYNYCIQQERVYADIAKNNTDFLDADIPLDRIEATLQKLHDTLRKDTSKALLTLISFLCNIDENTKIEQVYSIGFSYSDIDMKTIELISFLCPKFWHFNNYKMKLRKCGFSGSMDQFDFTKL